MPLAWNEKRLCDYCHKRRHKDETFRVKRMHRELWMCLFCKETRNLPRDAFYKDSTVKEYERKGR